jgi:hypothetical protein
VTGTLWRRCPPTKSGSRVCCLRDFCRYRGTLHPIRRTAQLLHSPLRGSFITSRRPIQWKTPSAAPVWPPPRPSSDRRTSNESHKFAPPHGLLGDRVLRNPTTGTAGCCACSASGSATAPPSINMNSRRLMSSVRPPRVSTIGSGHRIANGIPIWLIAALPAGGDDRSVDNTAPVFLD